MINNLTDIDTLEEIVKKRIETFKSEFYTVAFSGGAASLVLKNIIKQMDITKQFVYLYTPLEDKSTLNFIKKYHEDVLVKRIYRTKDFFDTFMEDGFPTKEEPYCCEELKSLDNFAGTVITGSSFERNGQKRGLIDIYKDKAVINPLIDCKRALLHNYLRVKEIKAPRMLKIVGNVGCVACPYDKLSEIKKKMSDKRIRRQIERLSEESILYPSEHTTYHEFLMLEEALKDDECKCVRYIT